MKKISWRQCTNDLSFLKTLLGQAISPSKSENSHSLWKCLVHSVEKLKAALKATLCIDGWFGQTGCPTAKKCRTQLLEPLISIYLLLIKGHLPICHPLTHWLAANVSLSFLALVSCKERKIKVEDQASWLHRSPIEGRFGDSRPSFGGNLWKPRLYCNFYFSPEVRR